MITKLKFLLAALLLSVLYSTAQMNTASPYSRFGTGEITHSGFAHNLALGNSGIALRSGSRINYFNPASFTSIDSMSFIFDFGLNFSTHEYKTNDFTKTFNNYNIDHIAIAFPVTKWWKSSVGVIPYSAVGYNIKEQYLIPVVGITDYFHEGTGGISRFIIGNGFKLGEELSVGVNLSYLFGYQNYTQRVQFPNDPYSGITLTENNLKIKGMTYNFGLQYHKTILDKYFFTLGGIFDNKINLKGEDFNSISVFYPGTANTIGDSITVNPNYSVVADTTNGKVTYPARTGIGLSLGIKDKLIITGEYSTQQWSKAMIMGKSDSLVNSSSMNFGVEYTPGNSGSIKKYFNRIHYRIGGYYINSNLRLRETQLKDYGITFGVGLPFRNTKTSFNLGFVLGQKGTLKNNLVKENYTLINFSMTFHDLWFIKTVID